MNDQLAACIAEMVEIVFDMSPVSREQLQARAERLREIESVLLAELGEPSTENPAATATSRPAA